MYAVRMDLGCIVLSEISQTEKTNTILFPLYVESNKINKHNRNKLTDTENKLMVSDGRGIEGLGEKGDGIKMYK